MICCKTKNSVLFLLLGMLSACTPAHKAAHKAAPTAPEARGTAVQQKNFDPTVTGFYFDEDRTEILRKPLPSAEGPTYERETHLVFRICLKNIYDTPMQQGRFEVAFETDSDSFTPLEEGIPERDGCFRTSRPVVLKHRVDDPESYRAYYLIVREKSAPLKRVALKKELNVFQTGKLFEWDSRNGPPERKVVDGPSLRLGVEKLSYFYPGQKADYQVDKWGHLTLKQFSRFRFFPRLKRNLSFTLQGEPQMVEDKLWPGLKVQLRVVFVASDMSEADLAVKELDNNLEHLRLLSVYEADAVVGQWGEIDVPVGFAYDFSEGPLLETFTQVFVEVKPAVGHRGLAPFVGVFPFAAVEGDMKEVGVTDMGAKRPLLIDFLERELVDRPGRELQALQFSRAKMESLLPAEIPQVHRLLKPKRRDPVDPDTNVVYRTTDYFVDSAAGIPKHVRNIILNAPDWQGLWPRELDQDLRRLLMNRLGRKDLLYPLYQKEPKQLSEKEARFQRQLRSPHAIYRAFAPLVSKFCDYFYTGELLRGCRSEKDRKPFEYLGMEILEFINGKPSVEKKYDEMDMFQAMAEYFREDLTSLKTSEGQQRTTTKHQVSGWDASPKFFGVGGGMGGGWSYNNGQYWHSDFAHVLDERVRGRTRQFGQLFVQIAKLYLSTEVSTCLLVSPKKAKPPEKGLFFCMDQHKDGIEHNWYYVDQEQQYRGFFKPSFRNQGDRKWLKIMRGKEFYDRLKRLMKARVVLILRQSDGSINGVDHIIDGALSELDELTFQTHTLGKHRDLGIYPGVIFYRDVERVYDDLLSPEH